MPTLDLTGLRIDKLNFDMRLWREGEKTLWEVTKGDPSAVEHRPFAIGPDGPWSRD